MNHACEPSINSDSITLPKLPLPKTFSNLKSSTPYFLNVGRDLTGGSLKLHRDSRLLFASALSLSLGLVEPQPLSELQSVPLDTTFLYYYELKPRIISLSTVVTDRTSVLLFCPNQTSQSKFCNQTEHVKSA